MNNNYEEYVQNAIVQELTNKKNVSSDEDDGKKDVDEDGEDEEEEEEEDENGENDEDSQEVCGSED